jgi:hypothetical protein
MQMHVDETGHEEFAASIHAKCTRRNLGLDAGTNGFNAVPANDYGVVVEHSLAIHGNDGDILDGDDLVPGYRRLCSDGRGSEEQGE